MGSWSEGRRPITLTILAMGGEGGGVLSDWIVAMAEREGWFAQNTSVAGVAQRTGATLYYVELYPPAETTGEASAAVRPEPVLSTMPTPGEVDIVIASELMEAGRAVQRGIVTPDRTTLIASTNRVYSMAERSSLGDGRVDSRQLLDAARAAAKRFVSADFMRLAEREHSVISASLFGALAGAHVLPFARERFESTIGDSGKVVERSLAAFAAGFDAARADSAAAGPRGTDASTPPAPASSPSPVAVSIGPRPLTPDEIADAEHRRLVARAVEAPESLVGPRLRSRALRVAREFPAPARAMLLLGCERTAVFQDLVYTDRYLDRVARLAALDDGDREARLSTETARYTALWMCYQDTIHVGLQKTRRGRLEKLRAEAQADSSQLMQVREYLHPQLDEITDTMPTAMGRVLARSRLFQRIVGALTRNGIVVNTTSVLGFTMLSLLARLRPMRPRTLRFGREQEAIDRWLDVAVDIASTDPALACGVIESARVLKGYGETWARGQESFQLLVAAARSLVGTADAADRLAALSSAALADEDGSALRSELAALAVA